MTTPTPSAWRYTHKDRGDNFISYGYSTEKPKMSDHPLYTPMFTRGQLMEAVYTETEPVWMDAKRLAMELECLLMSCDLPACSKWWDSAHEALELHRQLVKERQEQE